MSSVAILGAGPIGSAVAQALAERGRVRAIVLIDDRGDVAAGKALDVRQSMPIAGQDVRLTGSADALESASANVVVLADRMDGGEWEGEAGLALLQRLTRAGIRAPIVCAGPRQAWLMEHAVSELKLDAARLIGTAASAMAAAARALVALEVNLAGRDVSLDVVGRAPRLVCGWSSATISGTLVSSLVPPHRLVAVGEALTRLWPPAPYAVGAATSRVVEALVAGSRQRHHATSVLDEGFAARGEAAMLPLELGSGRILTRHVPSLSPQERTASGLWRS